MVKVKICGITSLKDAWTALDAGADALGFVFWPKSPRRTTFLEARAIIRTLPPLSVAVGVFVDESARVINEIASSCGLSFAQLHGKEDPSILRELSVPAIRATGIGSRSDLTRAMEWKVPLHLFDARTGDGTPGGTGKRLPLAALKAVPAKTWYFLAGGLTPSNVAAAVRKVRPFGVDVASGVERSPGIKDPALVKRFIRSAKAA